MSIINWSLNICQTTRSLTSQKNQKHGYNKFHDLIDFANESRETERLKNLKKSVKTSGHYLSIMNWSPNNIIYNILWPLSLVQSAIKVKKSWNFRYSCFWFLWIVRVRGCWQMFQLQFLIEKLRLNHLKPSTTIYDV